MIEAHLWRVGAVLKGQATSGLHYMRVSHLDMSGQFLMVYIDEDKETFEKKSFSSRYECDFVAFDGFPHLPYHFEK